MEDDKQRPKKQRHTAKRFFDRLRAEHAFTGGYTIVDDYVREKKLRTQEVFVPLTHQPGEAQADFGEAVVVSAVRFQRDAAAFLPLLAAAFEACEKGTARVSSLSLVRYHTNDYSVPTAYPPSLLYHSTSPRR